MRHTFISMALGALLTTAILLYVDLGAFTPAAASGTVSLILFLCALLVHMAAGKRT